jgi:hypothetical protein
LAKKRDIFDLASAAVVKNPRNRILSGRPFAAWKLWKPECPRCRCRKMERLPHSWIATPVSVIGVFPYACTRCHSTLWTIGRTVPANLGRIKIKVVVRWKPLSLIG